MRASLYRSTFVHILRVYPNRLNNRCGSSTSELGAEEAEMRMRTSWFRHKQAGARYC